MLFVCLLSVQTTGKINYSFIETVFRIIHMTQVYFMRPRIKELLQSFFFFFFFFNKNDNNQISIAINISKYQQVKTDNCALSVQKLKTTEPTVENYPASYLRLVKDHFYPLNHNCYSMCSVLLHPHEKS